DARGPGLCQGVELARDGKGSVIKLRAKACASIGCPDQLKPHWPLGRAAFADGDGNLSRLAAAKKAYRGGLADAVSRQPVEQLLGRADRLPVDGENHVANQEAGSGSRGIGGDADDEESFPGLARTLRFGQAHRLPRYAEETPLEAAML